MVFERSSLTQRQRAWYCKPCTFSQENNLSSAYIEHCQQVAYTSACRTCSIFLAYNSDKVQGIQNTAAVFHKVAIPVGDRSLYSCVSSSRSVELSELPSESCRSPENPLALKRSRMVDAAFGGFMKGLVSTSFCSASRTWTRMRGRGVRLPCMSARSQFPKQLLSVTSLECPLCCLPLYYVAWPGWRAAGIQAPY